MAIGTTHARHGKELYEKRLVDVDLSFNDKYQVAAGTTVDAKYGNRKMSCDSLIDKGAESVIMPSPHVRRLALGKITFSHKMTIGGFGGKVYLASYCKDVPVDVFGRIVEMNFLVSEAQGSIFLGRPWARRVRLELRNCDDGSCEGSISTALGEAVAFIGSDGRTDLRTIGEVLDKAGVSRN